MSPSPLSIGIIAGIVIRDEELCLSDFNDSELLRLLLIAKHFNLLHLIFNAVTSRSDFEFPFSLTEYELKTVYENTAQIDMWSRMRDAFEQNGVDVLMIKGILLRDLYPDSEMRDMLDIDLLYRQNQRRKMIRTMKSLGFEVSREDSKHLKFFEKQSGVTVEMHHTLRDIWNYENAYFDGLFERSIHEQDYNHIYRLCFDDIYVTTLLHIKKHILEGEYSLKRLCDIYLLINNKDYGSEILHKYLSSFNIERLNNELLKVCRFIFEGTDACDDTVHFAYCFLENQSPTTDSHSVKKTNMLEKLKYYASELFPNPKKIYVSFIWTYRHKILLPFGYLLRIFQCLSTKRKSAADKISNKYIPHIPNPEFLRKYGIISDN